MQATIAPPTAAQLKASALDKLNDAALLIASARQDLCNLEGHGYCRIYERCLTHMNTVAREAVNLRHLAPPTGVFQL